MKLLIQTGIITGICFVGEMLSLLFPLPIPGSVYGLVLLFLLLCFHIIQPSQIQDISDFFMTILPILFISPAVKLMTSLELLETCPLPIILILFLSTAVTTLITGRTAQFFYRRKNRKSLEENNTKEEL